MDKDKLVKCNELSANIEDIKNGRKNLEWFIGENFIDSFKDRDRKKCFKGGTDFIEMVEDLIQTLRKYYDHEELERLEKEFSEL